MKFNTRLHEILGGTNGAASGNWRRVRLYNDEDLAFNLWCELRKQNQWGNELWDRGSWKIDVNWNVDARLTWEIQKNVTELSWLTSARLMGDRLDDKRGGMIEMSGSCHWVAKFPKSMINVREGTSRSPDTNFIRATLLAGAYKSSVFWGPDDCTCPTKHRHPTNLKAGYCTIYLL